MGRHDSNNVVIGSEKMCMIRKACYMESDEVSSYVPVFLLQLFQYVPVLFWFCSGFVPFFVLFGFCSGFIPVLFQFCSGFVPVLFQFRSGFVPVLFRFYCLCSGFVPVLRVGTVGILNYGIS